LNKTTLCYFTPTTKQYRETLICGQHHDAECKTFALDPVLSQKQGIVNIQRHSAPNFTKKKSHSFSRMGSYLNLWKRIWVK